MTPTETTQPARDVAPACAPIVSPWPGRLIALLKRSAVAIGLALVLTQGMAFANRSLGPGEPAGFWFGMAQGAVMPASFPSLMLGRDVIIYAPHNTGIAYKLGYTLGVNVCGAIFFGTFYRRAKRKQTAS